MLSEEESQLTLLRGPCRDPHSVEANIQTVPGDVHDDFWCGVNPQHLQSNEHCALTSDHEIGMRPTGEDRGLRQKLLKTF